MKNYQKATSIFKRLFGVKPAIFAKMKGTFEKEYARMHKNGGNSPKLSIEDKLMITLKYLREYRTMERIGYDYWNSKSMVCESIQCVENTLVQKPKKTKSLLFRQKKASYDKNSGNCQIKKRRNS